MLRSALASRRGALVLALIAAAPAGCNPVGAAGEDQPEGRSLALGPGEPLRVTADEYRFDPGTVTVRGAPPRLEVTLRNSGSLAHNLVVLDGEQELGGTPSIPAGDRRTASVELEPGSYRYVCTVGDHLELGMEGELTIRR